MQLPKVRKTLPKPLSAHAVARVATLTTPADGCYHSTYATTPEWRDPIAIWHNKRSTLGFADGHAEMRGWVDIE